MSRMSCRELNRSRHEKKDIIALKVRACSDSSAGETTHIQHVDELGEYDRFGTEIVRLHLVQFLR